MTMRFSLIIPVYNVAPYLRACLDSVVAQTFADFECICVDDGSTDDSGAILDEYAEKDDRIKVVRQSNGGVGAARNAGLAVSRGEWICFLDADDVLNGRTLATYDRGIREELPVDLVAVGHVRFSDGMGPKWSAGNVLWRRFDCRETVPAAVYFLNLWACAFRADVLRGLQFGNLKIGEDRVFFSQVVEQVASVAVTDWIGYGYRQRAGSAFHSRDTAAPLLDDICHYATLTRTIRQSAKKYEPMVARQIGIFLIEHFADAYYRLSAAERGKVWEDWLAEMKLVSEMKGVRPYMRAIMRIVVRTRSKALARILIYGVLWLKLHGVNRRFAVHLDEDV